jgi:hypothetical protein
VVHSGFQPCIGDISGDGAVNVIDLLTLIGNFGPCAGIECIVDADCDDENPCTIGLCIGGKRCHLPIGGPGCGGVAADIDPWFAWRSVPIPQHDQQIGDADQAYAIALPICYR